MKLRYIYVIILVIFISCKKDKPEINKNSKFIKTWFDTVRVTPFMSKLVINSNKTFDYSGGACTSSFASKGSWEIINDTLILNSSKTSQCFWKQTFGLMCSKEDFEKNRDDNKTINNCNTSNEEVYVIFENEKFFMRNDTLIHTEINKYCPKLRTAFSSVKKVR